MNFLETCTALAVEIGKAAEYSSQNPDGNGWFTLEAEKECYFEVQDGVVTLTCEDSDVELTISSNPTQKEVVDKLKELGVESM